MNRSSGQLTVPMLMICLTGSLAIGGLWTTMRTIRQETQKQLELDRCMAKFSDSLLALLDEIDAFNTVIRAARASALATVGNPGAHAAAKATLEGAYRAQELTRLRFIAASPGCKAPIRVQWPKLPPRWTRLPHDAIGAQPLERPNGKNQISTQYGYDQRRSRFVVESDTQNSHGKWEAAWAPPLPLAGSPTPYLRPSID